MVNVAHIAARVRRLCEQEHISQNQLAREVGCTPQMLSMVLNGDRRPGLRLAVRLEARTGIPVQVWAEVA